MEHRVTIKEIAAEAGVSTGTIVHRALYGKKGLPSKRANRYWICAHGAATAPRFRRVRAQAQRAAHRGRASRPTGRKLLFYGSVWHGFRRCMAELDDYNLEVLELPYYPGTERGQAETLNACFEQYGEK